MPKVEVAIKDKLLLNTDEAAAILSTSAPTLKELVKMGLIRRMKLKGINKFYIEELREFCVEMLGKGIDPSAEADEIVRKLT